MIGCWSLKLCPHLYNTPETSVLLSFCKESIIAFPFIQLACLFVYRIIKILKSRSRANTLLSWEHESVSVQPFLPTSSLRASCFILDASISNFFNVAFDCVILLRNIITSVIASAEIKAAVRNIRL